MSTRLLVRSDVICAERVVGRLSRPGRWVTSVRQLDAWGSRREATGSQKGDRVEYSLLQVPKAPSA